MKKKSRFDRPVYEIIFELEIHNLFYIVRLIDSKYRYMLDMYLKRFITYKFEYNYKFKKMVRKYDKSFFSYVKDKDEYHFHINSIKDFLSSLAISGIRKENVKMIFNKEPESSFRRIKADMSNNYTLRDYQNDYVAALNSNKPYMLVDLATGFGKLAPLDSLIRVPDGWVKMGDIKVGDLVVTPSGNTTKVIAIHPHGKQKIYRITFYDGRACECGDEHLWKVYNLNYSKYTEKNVKFNRPLEDPKSWRLVNTKFLRQRIGENYSPSIKSEHRYYIPLITPEKNKDKQFIIHPYVLGCIIGDGGITHGHLKLTISSLDVIKRLESFLPNEVKLNGLHKPETKNCWYCSIVHKEAGMRNTVRDELNRLGLAGKNALNKFIPEEYLNGSEEQRWELLRGLIDTDGFVSDPEKCNGRNGSKSQSGNISYSTSSIQLRDNIIELVRSLGGIAKFRLKIPYYTHNGERKQGNDNYIINIRLKKPSMCCTKPEKLNRLKDSNQYSDRLKLLIKSIEYVGEKESQCITVEDPEGLYITNDYIVTHNSIIFTKALLDLGYVTGIVLLPRYIEKWVEDITSYTDITKDEICIVKGQDSLDKLWNTKKKDIKYKVFLFSITTLANFISTYEENSNDCSYSLGELSKHLGIGLLANDESHQHFNALFRISIHFEALRMIGMTATMVNNAADITRMYTLFYPYDSRVANLVKRDGYINVYPIMYTLKLKASFKYILNGSYNHNQFEQSLLRYPMLTKSYLKMIDYYLKEGFINHRTHNEKCIIFFSSIKLCTLATNYLRMLHKDLNIERYVEQDSYENIKTGDIIISTQQSLGTAFTVPNLITILNTVPMSSIQANKQNIGRLREIEGKELRYYYFYTNAIVPHRKMSVERLDAIKDISKSVTYKSYDELLIV